MLARARATDLKRIQRHVFDEPVVQQLSRGGAEVLGFQRVCRCDGVSRCCGGLEVLTHIDGLGAAPLIHAAHQLVVGAVREVRVDSVENRQQLLLHLKLRSASLTLYAVRVRVRVHLWNS